MDAEEMKIRHLADLCRRAEKTGLWVYSGFLSLAEQQAFRQAPVSRGLDFHFWGGSEWASPSYRKPSPLKSQLSFTYWRK